MFYDANVDSVDYRYGDTLNRDYRYCYRPEARDLPVVQVLKAVHCLEYQCCETSDWNESDAAQVLRFIEGYLVRTLPGYSSPSKWVLDCSEVAA